ncbi:hypothetical protein PRBEI_2000084500 [Prionailurus iriomotensis]
MGRFFVGLLTLQPQRWIMVKEQSEIQVKKKVEDNR